MNNLASNTHKRFRSLLDAVAADHAGSLASRNAMSPKISDLGPSVGDDNGAPKIFGLGPSVGDDNLSCSPGVTMLGPSVGDDNRAPDISALGPSVGDDAGAPSAPSLTMLGPSVGDDGPVSDLRLKEDVRFIGTTVFGLPLYHFRYLGRPETYEGVMAHEVLQVMPGAVSRGADGYYRVNYSALGTSMRRVS